MASYEHLDLLLGEALESLMEAAGEIRLLSLFNQKEFIKIIGQCTLQIWEIRDKLYEIKPEIKRDFVKEREADKLRYEQLNDVFRKASSAEASGQFELAASYYEQLLKTSAFGFFKLVAEAGLYRVKKLT